MLPVGGEVVLDTLDTFGGTLGKEISENLRVLEGKLSKPEHLF